ncbi:MAG TPA: glycosyl hydrolase, partial [Terriglobales bacterium]|nr:glycosyl hydrolase [Terriglobales bacterium]
QRRTIIWFIASRTGMMVKRPALGAEGFVLDHYDRAAIDTHLRAVGDRLMQAFGNNPPYAIFSDSLEVYNSDWTGDLLEQFRRRRGYDLTPYLPALQQDVGPKTAAVRHDWGQTLSELADERYLTPLREWAARHKTLFRSQSYGTPPVTLSSNRLVDLPEGEGAEWRAFSPTRWASSASHLYGKNVTSSETWTWLHSPAFRATPLDMKAQADLFFLQGINQLVGHGWPYSSPEAGDPGWRFYAAAVFNNHNPWWPVMPEVTGYLQRISYLLRQGKPANDVALLLPTDDAWSQFAPGKVSVSESMDRLLGPNVIPQILNAGFNFDFIDAEAINRVGIPYSVLILPGIERIPLDTYRKIEAFANNGGIVIATKSAPSLSPGLMDAGNTPLIREISNRLFQEAGPKGHLLLDETKLASSMTQYFKPDVSTSPPTSVLGFVHRKLPFADLYFLANTSNKPVHAETAFRVSNSFAEWWDPATGNTSFASTSTTLELNLQPYESRVIVFTNERHSTADLPNRELSNKEAPQARDLGTDWTVTFPKLSRTVHMDKLHSLTDGEETAFYSGEAIYKKSVEIPPEFLKPENHACLDFGPGTVVEETSNTHELSRAWLESPVREAASVFVNGQAAGSVWKPPYELDVSGLLHSGQNHLQVIVGNLAINTMAGHSLPDYRLLNARYGERFVPQDMENLQPLPSGLLGPVRLIIGESRSCSQD